MKQLIYAAEGPLRNLRWNDLYLKMRATYCLKNRVNILGDIHNFNMERQTIWILHEQVVKLVNKTSRSKLHVTEIQYYIFLPAIPNV